jgi:hypothetical protein
MRLRQDAVDQAVKKLNAHVLRVQIALGQAANAAARAMAAENNHPYLFAWEFLLL